MTDEGFWG